MSEDRYLPERAPRSRFDAVDYHEAPFYDEPLEEHREPSSADFLTAIRKRRRLILLVVLGFVAAGWLYCLMSDPRYTATATLEVRGYAPVLANSPVENMYGLDTRKTDYQRTTMSRLKRPGVADRALSEADFAGEFREYMKSRESWLGVLVDRITSFSIWPIGSGAGGVEAAELRQDPHYRNRSNFIQNYLGVIDVSPVPDTSLVEVSATTTDPRLSQRVANLHAQSFIEELREERHETLQANIRVLQAQADELRRELGTSERELAKYADANQLFSSAQSNSADLLMQPISKLMEYRTEASAKRIRTEALLRELENRDASDSFALDDDTLRALRSDLHQRQAEYATLGARMMPAHPQMVQLKAHIDSLRKALEFERDRILRSLRAQLESELATEQKLGAQIEEAKSETNKTSQRLVQYNLLTKESTSLRELYQAVLRQLQEARISAANSGSTVTISDYALVPTTPSAPKTQLIVLVSLFLGTAIGIGGALVLEVLVNRIITPEEAQTALRAPFLGFVPAFVNAERCIAHTAESPKRKLIAMRDNAGSANGKTSHPESGNGIVPLRAGRNGRNGHNGQGTGQLSPEIVSLSAPHTVVSEALRTIRAGILLSSADNPPKMLLVTSAEESEGKTTVATNLAITLAQASHRTLLIDADLRKPQVARLFGIHEHAKGLVENLTGHAGLDETILRSPVHNLDLIPAGSLSPNPAELVGSQKMAYLMGLLKERYDFVLLDAPPVLPVADSLMLSRVVDSVVLVVRSDRTDRGVALEARRRLARVNARLLGVVLNDFDLEKYGSATSSFRSSYYAYSYGAESPARSSAAG